MSLLSTIETIGRDIAIGIEVAAPIIGEFEPQLAPIFIEVAQIIQTLEEKPPASPVSAPQMSSFVQAIALGSALKQASAPKP